MMTRSYLLPKVYGHFICTHCGTERESLDLVFEPHGERVAYDACTCGGSFDNAVKCEYCGEKIPESEARKNWDGEIVCEHCFIEEAS